jgi:hypothetical protein
MTDNNLATSELVLNDDGSVYHLHLKPENMGITKAGKFLHCQPALALGILISS